MEPVHGNMSDAPKREERADAERMFDESPSAQQELSPLHDLVGVSRGKVPPFHYERKGDGVPLWVFVKEEPYLTYLVGYNVSSVDESGDGRRRNDHASPIANAEVLDLAAFPHIRVPADKLSQLIRVLENRQSGISVVVIQPEADDGRHPRVLCNLVAGLIFAGQDNSVRSESDPF